MIHVLAKSILVLMTVCSISTPAPIAQTVEDDYLMAAGYFSRGQWQDSVNTFEALIVRYPQSEQATTGHFFLGESLVQLERHSDAYRAFQAYLQRRPQGEFSPRATFRMGESAYRMGNPDTALRLLEIFVRQNPQDSLNEYSLAYLGEIRLKRQEPQLAQRAYETCLKMFPHSSLAGQCRFGLAKAFQMQGANAEAQRFFQFVCDRSSNLKLIADSHLQLGIMLVQEGSSEAASRHLTEAMGSNVSDQLTAEAAYWLARVKVSEEDYEKAFELLRSVSLVSVHPELATSIYFDGAVAAIKVGKSGVADNWLGRLRNTYPNHALADDALHMQIGLSQQAADRDRTAKLAQRLITEYPHSRWKINAAEILGRIHYAEQEYSKSIEVFSDLLKTAAQVPDADSLRRRDSWTYFVSLCYLGQKNWRRAERTLEPIENAELAEEIQPLVQIALATARFGQTKFESSIPNYRRYLSLEPHGKEALRARVDLAIALAETGKWDQTLQAFDDLQAVHGDEPIVLETAAFLADAASANELPDYASVWYQILATRGASDNRVARSLHELAWMKMEQGYVSEAMELFSRLLTEFPDSKFSQQAAMARAKFLDEKKDYAGSSQLYGFVIRRFNGTDLANIARLRRAHAMQQLGDRTSLFEARTLLDEYLGLPPDQPHRDEANYRMAWVNLDLGLIDDAHDYFRKLTMDFPNSKYWADASYRLAKYELNQNREDMADQLLEALIVRRNVPEQVMSRALFLKGQLASKSKDWERVERYMRQLIDSTNDSRLEDKGQYWYAEALYQRDRFQPAVAAYARLARQSSLNRSLQPWVWLRHAQCLGRLSRWESALQVASEGLERFPEFSGVYELEFVRGRGLEDAGLLNDARQAYLEVVNSESGGKTETAAMAQWRIGETYFHQENYKQAIQAYYRVDSLFSFPKWRSAALLQAGKCQEHLGNWRHAMKLYSQLIATFPDSDYAKTARERLKRVTLSAQIQTETEAR